MTLTRTTKVVFVIASLLNIIASATHSDVLDHVSKPFMVPMLAILVWIGCSAGTRRPVVTGLIFASAGDIALMSSSTAWFLIGMGLFLGAHLSYITAFAREGAITKLRERPAAVIAYGAVLVVALVLMWSGLGGLAVPIAVYALALTTMAATASTFGWWIGAGGALFLVSDMLIAVHLSGVDLPARDVLVMVTYALGQGLIATGWVRRTPAGAVVPVKIPSNANALSRN